MIGCDFAPPHFQPCPKADTRMATHPTASATARASAGSRASGGSSADNSVSSFSSFTTDEDFCDDFEIEHVRALQSELVQIVENSEAATGGSEESSPLTRKRIARDVIHCFKYSYIVKEDGDEPGYTYVAKEDGVEPGLGKREYWERFLGMLHARDKLHGDTYFEMVDLKMLQDMLSSLFAYDLGRSERKVLARTGASLDSLTIGHTTDHPMSDADA